MNDYIRITKRRLIATAALTLAVFAMVVALPSDSADATHYEGSYQDITWTIDDGVMVISGSGSIPLQKSYSGWNNYLSSVTELIIEEGITGWSSGNVSQFTGIDGLQAASFPDSLVVGGAHFLPNVTFYDIDGTTEISHSYADLKGKSFVTYNGKLTRVLEAGDVFTLSGITFTTLTENPYTLSITGYSGTGSVTIPAHVTYGTVTSQVIRISESAFSGSGVTSVTIPATVSVSEMAFRNCLSLVTVVQNYPDMSEREYEGCTALQSVTLPSGLTCIGDYSFSGCSSLAAINLPETLVTISEGAFAGCTSLETLDFPASLASIEQDAFQGVTFYESDGETVLSPTVANLVGRHFVRSGGNLTLVGPVAGETFTQGDFQYKVTRGADRVFRLTVTGGPASGDVVVPSEATYKYATMEVYAIGKEAFMNSSITSINIPDSVWSLGQMAFYGCHDLVSVTGTATILGSANSMFFGCSALESISLTFRILSPAMFSGCSSLETVNLSGVMNIPNSAFYGCSSLGSINVSSVTVVGIDAFNGCSSLSSLTFSPAITSIGARALQATSIESFVLSSTLNAIGEEAFKDCIGLESVVINNAVMSEGLFSGCVSLASVEFAEGVSEIPSRAFEGCSGLEFISFPQSLQTLAADAFDSVTFYAADGVTVLSDVEDLSGRMFAGSNGALVRLPGFGDDFVIDGITYRWTSQDPDQAAVVSGGTATSVTIPGSLVIGSHELAVTAVLDEAFRGSNVTSVVLPASVKTLGEGAFRNCAKLATINLGSVEQFGDLAFYDDVKLASVDFASAKSIGANAFQNCKLVQSINLCEGLETIGESCFTLCSGLSTVSIPSTVTMGNSVFATCSGLRSFTLPQNMTSVPYGTFASCTSLETAVIPEGVQSLGGAVFNKCSSLESVSLPSTLGTLGASVFNSCTSLMSVEIPSGVTSIGVQAFSGCRSLESVTLPANLTTVPDNAFYSCSALKSVEIPSGVYMIGTYVFQGCTSLESVSLPSSLRFIHTFAFQGCTSLESVEIPSGVRTIESQVFMDCTSLKSVSLPSTLESLKKSAFNRCSSLLSIVLPEGVVSLDSQAFYGCTSLQWVSFPTTLASMIQPFDIDFYDSEGKIDSVSRLAGHVFARDGDCMRILSGGDFSVGNLNYTITSLAPFEAEVSGYSGTMVDLVVPDTVEYMGLEYYVVGIGDRAFRSCKTLVTADLGSCRYVGDRAFSGCSALKNVSMDCVTEIAAYGFYKCTALESIAFSSSLEYVGDSAFHSITFRSSSSSTLPRTAEGLAGKRFLGTAGDLMTVPAPKTKFTFDGLRYSVLEGEELLVSLIGYVESPTDLTIPEYVNYRGFDFKVESVGNSAFSGCATLTSLDLGSVKSVGAKSFYNCPSLTSINLGSVESVGSKSFSYCKISSLDVPETLKYFGQYSFFSCSLLTSLTITGDDVVLDTSSFSACKKMKTVEFTGKGAVIGTNAFYKNNGVESIDLSTVASVGFKAFPYCNGMTSLTIPGSLGTVSSYAFFGCANLKTLVVEDGVKKLNRSAFSGCRALESVYLPASLKTVGTNAFHGVTLYGESGNAVTSAADLAGRLFQGTGGKLYSVPLQDGDEFVSGGIRYSVTSADGLQVSVIGHGPVGRSLTIPATVSQRGVVLDVVSVASKAFYVCEGLKTVTISGATTIGSKAFAYCPVLTTVRLGDSVTAIGDYAFYGCSKIADINVPQGASVRSHTFGSLKFYDGDTLLTLDQIPGGHYVGSGGKLYLTAA